MTIGATPAIPAPAAVSSLDLALIGTPSARTVTAAYRVNGGDWTVLPTVLTLPTTAAGKFFGTQAQAGILVSHKGGLPFVATYDGFAVTDGNVTGAAPAQQALYRLDVAGAGNYTDSKGQVWTPDTGRYTPTTAVAEGATTTPLEIANTDDDVLFRTYRGNVGNVAQAQRVLNYVLPAKGATTVDVRLYFAERASGNNTVGKRVFDINVEGRTVRSNFDIVAAAGGQNTATVLPINDVTVTGGLLELGFTASIDYPSIAAIEVLCKGDCPVDTAAPATPTGLTATAAATGVTLDWADNTEADLTGYDVYRSAAGNGTFTKLNASPVTSSAFVDTTTAALTSYAYRITAVDSSENASVESAVVTVSTPAPPTQAPVYINTGGPTQTVNGVTWAGCATVTACNNWVSGGNPYVEADTITGIPAGLNNTMFQSEWTGTAATGSRAFGFAIPVLNGTYQVRLYYAELNKTAVNTRTFDVRLENTTVASNFDVFQQAGGIDRAIVRSYNATVTDGDDDDRLHPSHRERQDQRDRDRAGRHHSTVRGDGGACHRYHRRGQRELGRKHCHRSGRLPRVPLDELHGHLHAGEHGVGDRHDVRRHRGPGRHRLLPGDGRRPVRQRVGPLGHRRRHPDRYHPAGGGDRGHRDRQRLGDHPRAGRPRRRPTWAATTCTARRRPRAPSPRSTPHR